MFVCMEPMLTYRGRTITDSDVSFIRRLIADNPALSRRALSEKLCEAWNWRQANGALRAMVCRSLMLQLHRSGHIELPPVRWVNKNPLACSGADRRKPIPVLVDTTPFDETLFVIRPLEFRQVRHTREEPLFNSLIDRYHYLGYTQPVGEHLKYLIYSHGRPIACMAWSSAPRHLGPRDRFIGWSAEARRKNIRFLAYNTRFLILPFVRVEHLASHILGSMAKLLPVDWDRTYSHPVHYLETFVDPGRFRGTCYRAANWNALGLTTGLGKDSRTKKPNRSLKEVLGYPLVRDFRRRLGEYDGSEPQADGSRREGTGCDTGPRAGRHAG
jgi:hypothetical protein